MNNLSREKQIETIASLTEGVCVRATERLTGVNRGTILSLGVRVGKGCATLHNGLMRDLNVSRIELDEAWCFVAKKQARLTPRRRHGQRRSIRLSGDGRGREGDPELSRRQTEPREYIEPSLPICARACWAIQRFHRMAGTAIPAQLRTLSAST